MKQLALLLALLAPLALVAADPPTAKTPRQLLEEGLFEEEATRNLEKAAAAYDRLVEEYDGQRSLAATALFRLAEIRVRQARPADAIALYRRVLAEFPQEDALAKLSRDRLAGLGASAPEIPPSTAPTEEEAHELARLRELAKNSPDLLASGPVDSLNHAAAEGWIEVAKFLLEQGGKVDGSLHSIPPLCTAAEFGHKGMAELLLEHGAKVEAAGPNHLTPLMCAAATGALQVARVLIEHDADVKAATPEGRTALLDACSNHGIDLATLLLEHGADANALFKGTGKPSSQSMESVPSSIGIPSWGTPLLAACGTRDMDLVKLLLAHHADPNAVNPGSKASTLELAVFDGGLPMMNLLLASGADPSKEAQFVALSAAASSPWRPEMVRLLLDHGAVPQGATVSRRHPARPRVVVLTPGASPDSTESQPLTPLLQSVDEADNPELNSGSRSDLPFSPEDLGRLTAVWEALLGKGADINAEDGAGRTALGRLVQNKRFPLDLAGWLIQHGADIKALDRAKASRIDSDASERRLLLEERFLYPKLAQPTGVAIVSRLLDISGKPIFGQKTLETSPSATTEVGRALWQALEPTWAKDNPAIAEQNLRLPLDFQVVVLRAKTSGGALEEATRVPVTVDTPASALAWPPLRNGDVVVLFKDGQAGSYDQPQRIQKWLTKLGYAPASEPAP